MSLPWLSAAELTDLCKPLTQPAAQCRFLREEFGIEAKRRPDGSLIVMRAQLEPSVPDAPGAASTLSPGPNRQGLLLHLRNRA